MFDTPANLGNLVLIVLPTICHEDGSPFGDDHDACSSIGLSYASFSMAVRIYSYLITAQNNSFYHIFLFI